MVANWDEKQGRVSRAFDEWKLIERDQRTFLRLGLAFATAEYDRLWELSAEEPYIEDGSDQLESFAEKADGLHQPDFDWMHLSGVGRDAVTNFEVYLEKAREEVLHHHGQPIAIADDSPKWGALKRFFRQLHVLIETEDVKRVRDLRHFLSHRRGELRTEELRNKFQETQTDLFPSWAVELNEERVTESLDALAVAVRSIDPAVYEHTWGRTRITRLRPLIQARGHVRLCVDVLQAQI